MVIFLSKQKGFSFHNNYIFVSELTILILSFFKVHNYGVDCDTGEILDLAPAYRFIITARPLDESVVLRKKKHQGGPAIVF